MSNSLQPHEPQHTRPPCPSLTPGVHPNPGPLSRWCHPTISSSIVHFSSCPQSFLASGSFQMSQLFTSGGQSIGVSASTSVLPMNTQDWSPLGWTGWISLSPRDPQESSPSPKFKSINSSAFSFLYSPTLISIHDHWKKFYKIAFYRWNEQVNTCILISWSFSFTVFVSITFAWGRNGQEAHKFLPHPNVTYMAINWHLLTSNMLKVPMIFFWSQGFSIVTLKCDIVKTVSYVFHTTMG